MARYRVPTQALRNFLSILLGFALGGINNLVVLPWAFSDALDEWGLVRVAAAWGTLIGPILALGAPAAMNRFSARLRDPQQLPALYGTLFWPPLFLFLGAVAVPALFVPEQLADLLDLEGSKRMAVRPIALLAGIQAAQIYFTGFLSSRLKTSFATLAKEFGFKLGYLGLAVGLGLGAIGRTQFLPAFVALNGLVLAVLITQSLSNRFRLQLRGLRSRALRKEVRRYGATLVIGSSAIVILGQLDIIMIGQLLGLNAVPAFTIAAFVATVAVVPHRAFQGLLQPLISQAVAEEKQDEISRLLHVTHRSLFLASGWILTCLWVCTPEIDRILPESFRGLAAVILIIGLTKVVQCASLGSRILLSQSQHFQKLLIIHWAMLAMAIPLNFWFIPDTGLGLGIQGAALATFLAVGASTLARQGLLWVIWQRFVPQQSTVLIAVILFIPGLAIGQWTPSGSPWVLILIKSALVTLWAGFWSLTLKLAPEGVKFASQWMPVLSRWT